MKVTKKITLEFVRAQLRSNKVWAIKALVRIFKENQTSQEQTLEATTVDNGIGFTGVDANFLSSLAKQYIEMGSLSDNQIKCLFKMMPKYSKQVFEFSDKEKLTKMVSNSLPQGVQKELKLS
jgi:DUF438 domain-containing protein